MKKIITISKENFPKAVKKAYSLNRKMATNAIAQYIVLPLGSMLFALHTLILLFGLALVVVAENNASIPILDKFPFIAIYCNWLWEQLCAITDVMFLKIFMIFALLYLIPVVVCGVIKLFFSLFIRGNKSTFGGSMVQQAKQLYKYIEQGPFPKKTAYDVQVIWSRISGISIIVCFVAVICYSLYTAFDSENTAVWIYILVGVIAVLEVIMIYILYAKMHFLLCIFMKPSYNCEKEWKSFKDESERYWVSVDPKENKKRRAISKSSYDDWQYKSLEKTSYYKEKFDEYHAMYMGQPYKRPDDDDISRLVKAVEEDLSGGGWGDY